MQDTKLHKVVRRLILLLGIFCLFYLDFVRDYFFKNVGFQIYYVNHLTPEGVAQIDNYTDSFLEYYIGNYTIQQLANLKWFGTFLFSFLFALVGSLLNYFVYQNKKVFIYFWGMYAFLFIISLCIYLLTYLTNNYSLQLKLYLTAMEIAHFLQSSLPSLLFLVSFGLYNANYSLKQPN